MAALGTVVLIAGVLWWLWATIENWTECRERMARQQQEAQLAAHRARLRQAIAREQLIVTQETRRMVGELYSEIDQTRRYRGW